MWRRATGFMERRLGEVSCLISCLTWLCGFCADATCTEPSVQKNAQAPPQTMMRNMNCDLGTSNAPELNG
jgi:hypothetical protein